MAETIRVASGVITFIDAGKKVLDLCARIKGAPANVIAHRDRLANVIFNVENFKRRHQQSPNKSALLSQPELSYVDSLLSKCTEHLDTLQQILGNLDNQFKRGRGRHAWASLVTVRKSGEILEGFSKLQDALDSLKAFLVQQSFWILRDQSSAISDVQDSLADLTAIQSQTIQRFDQSVTAASQLSAEYVIQELNRTLQAQTNDIVLKLDPIYALSAKLLQADRISQHGSLPPTSQDQQLSACGLRRSNARICTCKTRPAPTFRSFGAFHYQNKTRSMHELICPLREKSEREVSISLNIAIPALLSKSIQLAFTANFGAGGASISPAIKFPARVVDRKQSKGFQLMDLLISRYSPYFGLYDDDTALEILCKSILTHLPPLLENGSASAHDQDVTGATLLWVFAESTIKKDLRMSEFDSVCEVLNMMVNRFEADANIVVGSQTILDLQISKRRNGCCYEIFGNLAETSTFEERLLHYGCEAHQFTSPSAFPTESPSAFPTNSPSMAFSLTTCLFKNPELAFELGYPDHYQAIFTKSIDDLNKFIRKGVDWERYERGVPPAISVCARGWPEGLRRLLQIGVRAAPALRNICVLGLDAAIPIVISENCPAFSPPEEPFSWTMLGALAQFNVHSLERILRYVSESRRQLAAWGLEHLPHESQERQHIEIMQQKGYLLDELALSVWNALNTQPGSVPRYLFPGECPSVYFWISSRYVGTVDGKQPWEFLFDLGFKDVNIRDKTGCTPLLNALKANFAPNFRLAEFCLSKGAEIHPDFQWEVARGVAYAIRRGLPEWLFDIEPQAPCDSCQCYCSTSGCTPTTVLLMTHELGNISRRPALLTYISHPRFAYQEQSCFEACRLEIFERLGMTHTCCTEKHRSLQWDRNRIAAEQEEENIIQIKEKHLKDVLDEHLLIWTRLRARFGGHPLDFLRVWWAAVDLLLPQDDCTVSKSGKPAEEHFDRWWILPGVNGMHQCHDKFEEAKVWAIARNYFSVFNAIARFFEHYNYFIKPAPHAQESHLSPSGATFFIGKASATTFPEWLAGYLSSLDVPLTIIHWLEGKKGAEHGRNYEPSKGYGLVYSVKHTGGMEGSYIDDFIIPLVTASVITDLNEGRKIPEKLHGYLENCGIITDGKLRPIEEPEDIFEQSTEFLGL